MKQTRRHFAASVSLSGAVVCLKSLGLAVEFPDEMGSPLQAGLSAWMETLFPTDADSPGASELGVHLQVLEKAAGIPDYEILVQKGMEWCDVQAVLRGKPSFSALNGAERIEVVARAEVSKAGTLPKVFFANTLHDGATFYYGHQESWAGLGFPHPPQPIGFPDYTEAPTA